ncbi:MAG: M20/M25/M40 family metallo-hydrolase [Planctomycetota bacterium]
MNEAEQAKGKDGIYNGALDNASGCAGILAVARAWGKLDPKPKRSAMFLFVGSEEKGLLGSAYYAAHPIVPLQKTLANINVDELAVRERTEDVEVVGSGQSDLEDRLAEALARDGRHTAPDSESQNGYYYRSDHFNFARVGVPALYVKAGRIVPGKPENYLKDLADAWRLNDYHRPSDEYDPSWTCEGGAADAQALFRVGVAVAEGSAWPRWKDGSEFKARREASLKR